MITPVQVEVEQIPDGLYNSRNFVERKGRQATEIWTKFSLKTKLEDPFFAYLYIWIDEAALSVA